MTLLVDTSVWSLALRRSESTPEPAVAALYEALLGADAVVTTGLVLQELLQGFAGPKAAATIVERFRALPMIQPDRQDHIAAAQVRSACRRAGVQIGTIEALLIGLGAEVSDREGSRVAISLFQEVRVFHRPHPSPQTDKGAVASVRRWLEQHGVKP